jgi:hypothetical protein
LQFTAHRRNFVPLFLRSDLEFWCKIWLNYKQYSKALAFQESCQQETM